MEKTLYAVNRFGSLMFNIGDHTLIDGVRPIDIEGLKYIRASINFGDVERNFIIIQGQLIFTNVRNITKR